MYPRHAITPEHGRGRESIPLDCPRVTDRTAYIPEAANKRGTASLLDHRRFAPYQNAMNPRSQLTVFKSLDRHPKTYPGRGSSSIVFVSHLASISASSLLWTGLAMKSLIPA